MKHLYLLIALLTPMLLWSQTYRGRVEGKGGEALAGASVVAATASGSTVAYCITNDRGEYRLTIPEGQSASMVSVSYMGYQKRVLSLEELKEDMTITLTEGGFRLKEVKVQAQRIRSSGDTLTYSVSGFKQGQDRSIADVIAKMPGLEVKADGKIEYQGKAINKFYIEGLDLMGSQYGVANRNIAADKVESVQVLENHQEVKSLRGVTFSEQAALNLVLKEDAKAVWTGAADLGLGYGDEFLTDSRLMGMRFGKRFQTLMMYKTNNIGRPLADEVLDLAALLKGRAGGEEGLLAMMSVGTPALAEERYTFNRSHLLAGNWLWKTGRDAELRLQGNGYIDQTRLQSYHSSTYLTLADLPVVVEEQDVSNSRSEWKGEANYQYNGHQTYIRSNLRGYMDFNKSTGLMLYNSQGTAMSVKPRKRSVTEDFQLSHTTARGHVVAFNSYWSYLHLPGQLLTINGATERLNLGFFSTQNEFRYRLKVGRHYLNNEVGIDYDYQDIGVAMGEEAEQSAAYRLLRTYWTPSLSLYRGRQRWDVKSRVSYARQSYRRSESNHLWVDPALSWNWKATAVSEFSAHAGYTHSPLTGKAIYDIPIFTDYRTQRVHRGETGSTRGRQLSAAYKYTNPVVGLFVNVRPAYSRTSGHILYESRLEDDIYTMTATDREYAMQTAGLTGRISKSFGWAKTMLGLSATHHVTDYSLLVAGLVDDARMKRTDVTFDYSLRPLRLLSVEGKSGVSIYSQQNRSHPDRSSGRTTDWEHFLHLHLFPAGGWMLGIRNELFHSSDASIGTNYFLDGSLGYKAGRWELSLQANNLIGTSRFERRVLGNTVESYSITRLRPREFLVKWSFDM